MIQVPQVNHVTDAVNAMQKRADVCQTLYGGTVAMRAAGSAYLPQWPQETNEAYKARLKSSVLFPAFKKAIGIMVGKPLGSPIGVGDDVPARVEASFENIDRQGRDLDSYVRDLAITALRDGITWTLVDYPRVPAGSTLADEQALGANPYCIHIPLSAMLGWQRDPDGKLVQLRYMESATVPDGPWATKSIARVRVWTQNEIQVWQQNDKQEWVQVEAYPHTLGEIPAVAHYGGERTGLWEAIPALEDLAWLNQKHWLVDSDKMVSLHHACVPLKAADEDRREDPSAGLSLKASGVIVGLPNLHYVEHTGAAIGAARQELVDTEDQMQRLAGELLSRVVQKTAAEANHEATEGESWLRVWAHTFEDSLEEMLRFMALWVGEKQGGSLSLDFDWGDQTLAADMLIALTGARTSGEITRETYLSNLQKGKILPPGRTVEDEIVALDAEGPTPISRPVVP